jgi:hypothetical protein
MEITSCNLSPIGPAAAPGRPNSLQAFMTLSTSKQGELPMLANIPDLILASVVPFWKGAANK